MDTEFRFAALLIVLACLIIFPLQTFLPVKYLILVSSGVLARPWIVFTHIFLHGSPVHLLSNMFALGLFGSILERVAGWKRFLFVFFGGGIISSAGDVIFYEASLGASGALFSVLGALAALRPKMGVPAFGVPLPMAVAALMWAGLDLTGLFYPDGTAHAAHLFGMGFGLIAGFYLRKQLPEGKEKREGTEKIPDRVHREWEEKWMKPSQGAGGMFVPAFRCS
jgi:hypothetical protein